MFPNLISPQWLNVTRREAFRHNFYIFSWRRKPWGAAPKGQLAGKAEDALAAAGSEAQIEFTGLIGDGKIKPNQSPECRHGSNDKLIYFEFLPSQTN